jgi:hypothetical protein
MTGRKHSKYLAEVGLDAGVAKSEICERHHRVAAHLAAHRVPRRMYSMLHLQKMGLIIFVSAKSAY